MKQRTIFVYGPQGCGKTLNAPALAAHFGLSRICDADESDRRQFGLALDTLVLCIERPPHVRRAIAFERAMQLLREGLQPRYTDFAPL